MANESRFCGNCGAPMTGQFCGACGHEVPDRAVTTGGAGDGVQDAPTRIVSSDSADDPTSHRPSGDPRVTDAETGWYQSADVSANNAPYAGAYDSAPYDSGAYGADQGYGASAYTSGAYAPAPQPQRPNQTAAIAAGLVTLLVLACLGGYLLMRGGSSKTATPGPSNLPQSSQPMSPSPSSSAPTSSSPSNSQPSTQQPTPTPAPNTPTTPPSVVPPNTPAPTSTPTSTTPTASASQGGGNGLAGLSNVHEQISMNGSSYAVTQSGTSVAIYQDEGGSPTKLADITLPALPDYSGNGKSLELVALPGCSKPVLTFNSSHEFSSAAFGWNGSEYKVYKSTGSNLEPFLDDPRTPHTWGVYVENGAVVYKEKSAPDSPKNYFRNCVASSPPDVLQWDH